MSAGVNNFLLCMVIFLLFKNVQFSRAAYVCVCVCVCVCVVVVVVVFFFFNFCFQCQKTFSVTFEMLKQAFGTECMG